MILILLNNWTQNHIWTSWYAVMSVKNDYIFILTDFSFKNDPTLHLSFLPVLYENFFWTVFIHVYSCFLFVPFNNQSVTVAYLLTPVYLASHIHLNQVEIHILQARKQKRNTIAIVGPFKFHNGSLSIAMSKLALSLTEPQRTSLNSPTKY